MTVDVTIAFNYEEQYWTHVFKVEQGCSIVKLKEQMLHPKGTKQDIDAFELRIRGQRVSDVDEIYQEHTLDFEYLGPEEGAKRAKEDELDQKRREQEKAAAASKRKATSAAAKPATRPATKPAAKPAARPAAVSIVKVVVKHAMEEMQSQVTVEVPSNSTILDLRKAVMDLIGETKLSEVKIVKKSEQSFTSAGDSESIGIVREFLSMGRKLDMPTGSLEITVTVDEELDFKTIIMVPRGTKVSVLKDMLAAQDPTGSTAASTFGVGLQSDSQKAALADSTLLTDKHVALQVTEPYKAPPAPAASNSAPAASTAPVVLETIPGVPIWKVIGGGDKGGILVRKGRDIKSDQCSDRLSTAAVVEQLALEGERLNYKRITGSGPVEGWVSLTVSGKELVQRFPAESPEAFTLERAIALVTELRDSFASAEFKSEIAAIVSDFPAKKGAEYMRRRTTAILNQQMSCIPAYGFEGSQKGVQIMMMAFGPHMGSPITQALNVEVSQLIGA